MKLKVYRKLIFLCVLLEIFVFNINSFRIIDKNKYEKKIYTVDQMETTGFAVTGNILTYVPDYGQEPAIILKDINTNVGTLYLDMYLPNENYLEYTLYYTDEANQYLQRNFTCEYVPGAERTKWITCHFSGMSDEIKLVFDIHEDAYQMAIDACVINESVKFEFCFWRVLVLFVIISGFYLIRENTDWNNVLKRHNRIGCLSMITLCFLGVMWILYIHSVEKVDIISEKGDLYSQQLVDTLIDGDVKIHSNVSGLLNMLENPYDDTERRAKGLERDVDYIWDAAYYNGDFYVYFGVIPALLFFVPFKLMTGMYLSTGFVTVCLLCVYIIFLNLLLAKCMRKFFPDIPFCMYIFGILTIDAGSLAWCLASRAKFYELVYAAGLAFSAIGLYILVTTFWKERKNYIQIFTGGLCLAFAVGCRPTMVLYSFLLVPVIIRELKIKNYRAWYKHFIALMLPYVLVAIFLMWYNDIRFGSPFDFGQNYQITATDMAKDAYKLSALPWCVWLGLFQPLLIDANFPFIYTGVTANSFAGYFFNGANVIPVFSSVPVLYTMFIPKLWKKWKEKQGGFALGMLGNIIGIGWIMQLLIFVSAGVHIRYTMEALPLFIFSVILLICNYVMDQGEENRNSFLIMFYVMTIFTVVVAFLIGIVGGKDWIFIHHPEFYYAIERAFCFWK